MPIAFIKARYLSVTMTCGPPLDVIDVSNEMVV